MNTRFWLFVLAGILGVGAGLSAARAGEARMAFDLGTPADTIVAVLGKPTATSARNELGKEHWYYGKTAVVTLVNGVVTGWRGFNEQPPPARPPTARPLGLNSTKTEILAALGFPPNLVRYEGLTLGRKRLGNEEWGYRGVVLVLLDGAVCGWRNRATDLVSMGQAVEGKPPVALGMPAPEVVAALGTPVGLTIYADNADQIWEYPQGQLLLRNGVLTAPDAPTRPGQPDATPANGATTKPDAGTARPGDKPTAQVEVGFTEEPAFADFRIVFDRNLRRLEEKNPKIVNTARYRAMVDCLNGYPWKTIQTKAKDDPEYETGVQAIYDAYRAYLKQRDAENREN